MKYHELLPTVEEYKEVFNLKEDKIMKHREFWLNLDSDNRGFSESKPDEWLLRGPHVHTIEYSAYETLKNELTLAYMVGYEKAKDLYAEQNKIMREALEEISIECDIEVNEDRREHNHGPTEAATTAWEALEKCGSTEPTTATHADVKAIDKEACAMTLENINAKAKFLGGSGTTAKGDE